MSIDEMLLAADSENRQRALELRSFVVEAPAGAGKTELLVQRILKLLTTVTDPEAIVALTFTKKAAAEMRERLESYLLLARRGERPSEPHRQLTYDLACAVLQRSLERGWNLEAERSRLRLMTLDALCASLARQMPLLSRFGAQPAVADDARRHYREAARRTLCLIDDANSEMAEIVAEVLAYFDNQMGRLTELLATMLGRREQWRQIGGLDHPEAVINEALDAFLMVELGPIATELDAGWQTALMPLARFAAAQAGDERLSRLGDWLDPLTASVGDISRWHAVAALVLTKDGAVRQKIDKRLGFPADKEFKERKTAMLAFLAGISPAQLAALRRVAELPAEGIENAAIVRALGRLLKIAAAQLWLVFREQGEVDFVELAMRAIDALGQELDPSELGLRLDYQIHHLLVDEFQDTSPTQVELLRRLTDGWQPDDGRTLFVVGDPMQSIYRFRKADVGLFLNVAVGGIGLITLEPLRLSRNNRSVPSLIDWINRWFAGIFPAQDEPRRGQISYRPFAATRAPVADAGVRCHAVVLERDVTAMERDRREADCVVRLIEREWSLDPNRQIVILARARGHLAEIAAQLRRRGNESGDGGRWRFAAAELEPLLGRQTVQDLISLTRALHHRADRLNWLAILRAPWCGLTLADLLALAGADDGRTLWQLMNDEETVSRLSGNGKERLHFVRATMAEAARVQGRQSPRDWVERTWLALAGPDCLSSEAEAADASAFFDRLEAITDRHGNIDMDTLEADMSALYAAADTGNGGPPLLQLMTIHKAKGLEFDTVIVPGMHREMANDDLPLLAWESVALPGELSERLIVAPCPRLSSDRTGEPLLYEFLQSLEQGRGRNEALRVLYVAATRAKRSLHWVGVTEMVEGAELSVTSSQNWREPATKSPLAALWPAFCAEATVDSVEPSAQQGGSQEGAPAVSLAEFVPRLWRRRVMPAMDAVDSNAVTAANLPALGLPVVEDEHLRLAGAVGSLVHACLEQMAKHGVVWDSATIEKRRASFVSWLGTAGWEPAQAAHGAQTVAEMLRETTESDAGRWVLSGHADASAELAVAKVSPGGTAQIKVVDRTFVTDGVRWIVDYKSADLGGPPSEVELQTHAERYRDQLLAYADLFADAGMPVRCAILYTRYGKLVALD